MKPLPKIFLYSLLISSIMFSGNQNIHAQNKWYKGNTHTHTTYSNGVLSIKKVVDTYKSHGYDFLFITDHNNVFPPTDSLSDSTFICYNGLESISSVHLSCLNIINSIWPSNFADVIDKTHAQGGFAVVNHPQRVNSTVLVQQVFDIEILKFIEIFNGISSAEENINNYLMWDSILTAGKLIYGVASDDLHEIEHLGKGWIMVNADTLQKDSLLNAIQRGDFYSTTGVLIEKMTVTDSSVTILAPEALEIKFVGDGRVTLKNVYSDSATYLIKGNEGYIRVEVKGVPGTKAWTQPLFWDIEIKDTHVNDSSLNDTLVNVSILHESMDAQVVQIFPNPASDKLIVFAPNISDAEFILFDSNCRIILNGTIDKRNNLNVSAFPSGIYFLRIQSEAGQWNKKVLIY